MGKEKVYDEQISPLMAEIIKICKKRSIAMLCSFALPSEDDPDLFCTTALLTDEYDPPDSLIKALDVVKSPNALYAAYRLSDATSKDAELT